MSARSTRVSRRRSADPGADEEDTVQETQLESTQSGRGKRRRSNTADPDAGAATGAAAAAAAYDQTPGGAAGAGFVPLQQQQVAISQQDMDSLQEAIERYKKEADEAEAKGDALGFTRNAIDSAVARVVRWMLFKNYEKPGMPVKRQELNDVIQKDVTHRVGRGGNKLPGVVLPLAAAKLATAFGLEMREMKRHAASALARGTAAAAAAGAAADGSGGGAAGGSVTQTYVLRSLLPPTLLVRFVHDAGEDAMRGLMTVVVALLQLAPNGQIEAEDLWRQLSQLGVEKDPQPGYDRDDAATVFSNKEGAAGVLAHMERCRYVAKKSVAAAAGGQQAVYELAEAAHDEFGATAKALINQWLGNGNDGEEAQ
ncbi:hypothetical protein OEZ86_000321 [Tetradesmus obliquus]|nr:hypothetical protein OEZ86_000321 [Tetradesmus obliquus]